MAFKTDHRWMQVKSIAECWYQLRYHLSLRPLFYQFWVTFLNWFYCTCYFQIFKILVSLCSWVCCYMYEIYQVAKPKDIFSWWGLIGQRSLVRSMTPRTQECTHDHGSCKRGRGMSELVVARWTSSRGFSHDQWLLVHILSLPAESMSP